MTEPIRYAYIVASSYSGSTLLAMLLDTHPNLASIGELDNVIADVIAAGKHREYPCSCGQPIRQCDFFRQVQQRCAQNGFELDLHDFPTRLGSGLGRVTGKLVFGAPASHFRLMKARDTVLKALPVYRRHVNNVLDWCEAIARAVLDVSGKEVFVDASKGGPLAFRLLDRPGLDLRLVHIVRDARAFARSCLKHGASVSDLPGAIRYWWRTHSVALELKRRLPADRYFLMRWEDFCQRPHETLDRLCLFLGVAPADVIAVVNERPHHVIGNKIRLEAIPAIRSDETWREVLTAEQLAMCDDIGGEMNRSFGYE